MSVGVCPMFELLGSGLRGLCGENPDPGPPSKICSRPVVETFFLEAGAVSLNFPPLLLYLDNENTKSGLSRYLRPNGVLASSGAQQAAHVGHTSRPCYVDIPAGPMCRHSPLLLCFAAVSAWNVPLPTTWSNRLGLTITPISTGMWAAERPSKRFLGLVDVGARTVFARASDGSLAVLVGGKLEDSMKGGIEALGAVGHIIGTGTASDQGWIEAYPDAAFHETALAAVSSEVPGLECVAVEADGALDREHAISSSKLARDIDTRVDQRLMSSAFIQPWLPREPPTLLFHTQSKTLVCGEAWWNFPTTTRPNGEGEAGAEGTGTVHECSKVPVGEQMLPSARVPRRTRLWSTLKSHLLWPVRRSLVSQGGLNIGGWVLWSGGRPPARSLRLYHEQVGAALAWECEAIVPAHGDVLRGKEACRAALIDHFIPTWRRTGRPDQVLGEPS